jgi:RING-like zinc finger
MMEIEIADIVDLKNITNKNIGSILEPLLDSTKVFGLQICNDTLHGSFSIPNAIGFSTPLDTLGDLTKAIFVVYTHTDDKPTIEAFKKWKEIYSTHVYRMHTDQVEKISTDYLECAICLEEYKLGDELIVRPCKHKFHKSCIENRRMHCPLCRAHGILPSLEKMNSKDMIMQVLRESGY